MSTETPPPVAPVAEDRTVAILAYLTIIGFIVALVMHSNRKTSLGAYHLRQCLGLIITALVVSVISVVPVVGWLVGMVAWIGLLVLWLLGLVAAAGGKQKPVPLLGEQYQNWFSGAFA